ncbi:MAG: hypothetical protein ACI85N_000759 [Gammaproteobacteria bacterium]|jgi:hypothetical protein
MTRYFQNLELAQNRRMRYMFLSYMFSIIVGLGVGIYFFSLFGVMGALLTSYFLSLKLIELVYKKIEAPCPLCDAQELTEDFSLQCRPAKYQCEKCNSVYMKGILIEK